jgi:hypothetical protein
MILMVNPEMIDAEMIEATEFPKLSEKIFGHGCPEDRDKR